MILPLQIIEKWSGGNCLIYSCELRVARFELRVSSFEFRVSSFEFRVSSFEFRVSSFELRVSSCEFRVSSFEVTALNLKNLRYYLNDQYPNTSDLDQSQQR